MKIRIKGFDGYSVSEGGKVYSDKSKSKGCEIKGWVNNSGYRQVRLYTLPDVYGNQDTTDPLVHRLVAEAFIPNPEGKPIVNHKDGNKLNNRVENLEWCTASENLSHAYKLGLADIKGEKHPCCKLSEVQVRNIRMLRADGWGLKRIADLYQMCPSTIGKICSKILWSHVE